MNNYLQLIAVYRANGDTRDASIIMAEIKADEAVLNSPPSPSDVVGTRVVNGEMFLIMGDGSKVKQ